MKQTPEQWAGLVRRLNDGGCPVLPDHGYKVSPVGLVIEKIPCMSFSSIFDLQQGGTGFAIELTLRNEAPRPINIVGYQIRTPWGFRCCHSCRLRRGPPQGTRITVFRNLVRTTKAIGSSIAISHGARASCSQASRSKASLSRRRKR